MPGVHLRELQRALGISFNSTQYHVQSLAKIGKIECRKQRGFLRVYPIGTTENDKVIYSFLRRHSARAILCALVEKGILNGKQLSEITGLAKSTISEHIQEFSESNIVRTSFSDKRGLAYVLVDHEHLKEITQELPPKTLLDSAADRFVDLWDL